MATNVSLVKNAAPCSLDNLTWSSVLETDGHGQHAAGMLVMGSCFPVLWICVVGVGLLNMWCCCCCCFYCRSREKDEPDFRRYGTALEMLDRYWAGSQQDLADSSVHSLGGQVALFQTSNPPPLEATTEVPMVAAVGGIASPEEVNLLEAGPPSRPPPLPSPPMARAVWYPLNDEQSTQDGLVPQPEECIPPPPTYTSEHTAPQQGRAHRDAVPHIANSELGVKEHLASGSFKSVYKVAWEAKGRTVALLVLRNTSTAEVSDMEKEIRIFTSIGKHRYLPELLATCTEEGSGDTCMIMEFAPLGSLDQVLSKAGEDGVDVTSLVSITIAAQVADGMGHLHLHDIIHRDLAARNILVFAFDPHDWKRAHIKVTDYGLALLVSKVCAAGKTIPEITTNGRRSAGPTRWMAPESLGRRLYSKKSDVWAFGVLLYEIMSLAMLPYFDIGDDREVARAVLAGERLPKPELASDDVYAIMQSCWRRAAKKRPCMPDVQARLLETFATETLASAVQEDSSKRECVVCLERVSTHALMPCGHRCVCEKCAQILNNRACPICRTLVEKAVRIFG